MITVDFQWGDGDPEASGISKRPPPRPGPMDNADFAAMHDGRSQDLYAYQPGTTAKMLMDLSRQHLPMQVWRANMDGQQAQASQPYTMAKVKPVPFSADGTPNTQQAQDQPVPNADPSPDKPLVKVPLDPPVGQSDEPDPGPTRSSTPRPTARPSTRTAPPRQAAEANDQQSFKWPERSGLVGGQRKSLFQRLIDGFSGNDQGSSYSLPNNSFASSLGSNKSGFFEQGDMGSPHGGSGIQWSDGTITDLGDR